MTKITLPFGEWRPDVALLDNQFISIAENVYPGVNAYFPISSTLAVSGSTSLGTGNDGFTKVMLYFDGADAATTITDNNMGGSAHTWTAAGNAQIDTAQSKFGGSSLLCDGTGDWVSTPESSDFAVGIKDWTVDCFARPAVDGSLLYICGCADSGLNATTSLFVISRTAANKVEAKVSNGTAFTTLTGTSTNFTTGSFKHVRLVKTGTTLILYLDGTQEATGTVSPFTTTTGGNPLVVGAGGSITTTPWNGWIDGFKYDVGIARSTGSSFSVPTADYDGCRGLFMGRDTAGLNVFFAGTVRKIYKATSSNRAWTDVTRASGPYSLAPGDLWSFDQFGANIYATQVSDVLQSIDATAGANFAAVGGSPPQAGHVKTVGDFLVLSGLASNKQKLQWSAINDPTSWTVGTNLSDEQTLPDGGDIRGIAGDVVGLVIQDRAIRTMQFLPGDTDRIFAFSKVESERGAVGKLAFCYTNNTLFFRGSDGFYAWNGAIQPIGQDFVNNWFNDDGSGVTIDTAKRDEMVVFATPGASRIMFAYYHGATTSNLYDRLLIYDYHLNKWTYSTEDSQMWGVISDSNLTKKVGCVDPNGLLALLADGTTQSATIETAEQNLNPGMRSLVTGAYPLIDTSASATVTVTPYTREDLNDTSTAGSAASREGGTGWASILSSSRMHKFRLGTTLSWTQASGIIVEHQPDGEA